MYFLYITSPKVTGPTINGTLFLQCKYHNILYYIILSLLLYAALCVYIGFVWSMLHTFFLLEYSQADMEKKCSI